ncbi:hypothetical protein VTL71DRAFT_14162 [Oculimacula yallundae]|uniref:Glutathione S-transferase n=1 Tax=Oculimacula yallundae TaxID=86028 RepID=A0ABR4CHP5_9HELO
MSSTLTLYNHDLSSYAQKIRIALREKKVPFNAILPPQFNPSTPHSAAEFQAINPRIEVPTLIDGDVHLFDSTIILEYLEDKSPSPALLPDRSKAAERAKARMIEDLCDTQYEAINWGWGEVLWMERAHGELREKLKAEVEHQLDQIHAWLSAQLGEQEYFGGEFGFGWADVCVGPYMNRSDFYGFGPKEENLKKWLQRVKGRESVRSTFEEARVAAEKMKDLAPSFKSGERKREYRDNRLEWLVKSGGVEIVLEGLKKKNIRFLWPDTKLTIGFIPFLVAEENNEEFSQDESSGKYPSHTTCACGALLTALTMHLLPILASLLSLSLTLASPSPQSRIQTSGNTSQASGHVIHQFPIGSWVENLAVLSNGQILATLISEPSIYIIDPSTKITKLLHSFEAEKAVFGITETTPSLFYLITSSNFSISPASLGAGSYSIYSLNLTSYKFSTNTGALISQIISIPESPFLNGLTTLSASRGLLLASGSIDGKVWVIDVKNKTSRILAQGTAFESPPGSRFAGVNGIRVLERGDGYGKEKEEDIKEVHFSNQGTATFSCFNVSISTLTATSPEVLHTGFVIDDFALGFSGSGRQRKEVAYAASRENELLKVPLRGGGEIQVLYGDLNETVLPGPTSVVLGREGEDGSVFVGTNGGLNGPVNGIFVEGGKIVKFDVGC